MTCAPSDYLCLINNCSGEIGQGQTLFNYWQAVNCPAAYAEGINTDPGTGLFRYNPISQQAVQVQVANLFDTYNKTNSITDDVTSSSYNPFQNTLRDLCLDPALPGICDKALTSYCAPFTRQQVINSPINTSFCGCYVPPDPTYLTYTLGSSGCAVGFGCTAGCTAGEPGCTGQPACDPLCHRALTVQKAYQPTGALITCPENICVIDNVTINAIGSRVPGGINFNSVCSGCGGATGADGCLCIVSGVNISQTAGDIGLGVNFNQFCGTGAVCLVEDADGNIISQGCTGINPLKIPVGSTYYPPNLGLLFILALILAVVILACIAAQKEVK